MHGERARTTDVATQGDASVSVVICAYSDERWGDLAAAVASVERQTVPPAEIVVVVDHNPRLLARVRAELPGVVVTPNVGERGLSGARNSGIAVASAPIVAFMDDDAEAAPDWLARLLAEYADERVIGAGGGVEPFWIAGRPRSFPAEFGWVVGCSYRGMPESTSPVRNVIGANMSFRRDVFGEIGGFRAGIGRVGKRPVGCEETELCIRAHQRNPDAVVLYVPLARVHHRVPATRAGLRYFVSRCYSEGLSKAVVARIAGARDALATERAYALRSLSRGFGRGLADALRGDAAGVARSGAIALGLFVTTAGYLVGAARGARVA